MGGGGEAEEEMGRPPEGFGRKEEGSGMGEAQEEMGGWSEGLVSKKKD